MNSFSVASEPCDSLVSMRRAAHFLNVPKKLLKSRIESGEVRPDIVHPVDGGSRFLFSVERLIALDAEINGDDGADLLRRMERIRETDRGSLEIKITAPHKRVGRSARGSFSRKKVRARLQMTVQPIVDVSGRPVVMPLATIDLVTINHPEIVSCLTGSAADTAAEIQATEEVWRSRIAGQVQGIVAHACRGLTTSLRGHAWFDGDPAAILRSFFREVFRKPFHVQAPAVNKLLWARVNDLKPRLIDIATRGERLIATRTVRAKADPIFDVAFRSDREVIFISGPPNAGKTYQALDLLAAAESGVILSPLRLLAMEHREALQDRGIPASLVTGEEEILEPGARHTAMTIESFQDDLEYDTVVIDEFQMIADPHRGWAWSRAIFGANARRIILTGSPDALTLVRRIAATTRDRVTVVELQRKTPLRTEPAAIAVDDIAPGDALVAFSRADVHNLRSLVAARGLKAAIIYGPLGPEVRRSQAELFRTGQADVLIATDAIGMGLNIPNLRRVVFSRLRKYDGIRHRPLSNAEIRQIAGRAGRFGFFDHGLCAVLDAGDQGYLERAIAERPAAIRLQDYPLRPPRHEAIAWAKALDITSVVAFFERLGSETCFPAGFTLCSLDDVIERGRAIDHLDLPLDQKVEYAYAPIEFRMNASNQVVLRDWAAAHGRGEVVPAPAMAIRRTHNLHELENQAHLLTVYAWLSKIWPDTYPDKCEAVEERRRVNAKIHGFLSARS